MLAPPVLPPGAAAVPAAGAAPGAPPSSDTVMVPVISDLSVKPMEWSMATCRQRSACHRCSGCVESQGDSTATPVSHLCNKLLGVVGVLISTWLACLLAVRGGLMRSVARRGH